MINKYFTIPAGESVWAFAIVVGKIQRISASATVCARIGETRDLSVAVFVSPAFLAVALMASAVKVDWNFKNWENSGEKGDGNSSAIPMLLRPSSIHKLLENSWKLMQICGQFMKIWTISCIYHFNGTRPDNHWNLLWRCTMGEQQVWAVRITGERRWWEGGK